MFPYAGKPAILAIVTRNKSEDNVMDLTEELRGGGRNVTMDRYYTGVDLAKRLHDDHYLTVVGTIKKNRQHVPEEMKVVRGRDPKTCLFAWDSPTMLGSHIYLNRGKMLCCFWQCTGNLIFHNARIALLRLYCFTMRPKGGVDTVDQMIDTYRCKVATNRWPMVTFFTIVDIVTVNALVILLHNVPDLKQRLGKRRRRHFLLDLGLDLIKPWVQHRSTNLTGLRISIRVAMEGILWSTDWAWS